LHNELRFAHGGSVSHLEFGSRVRDPEFGEISLPGGFIFAIGHPMRGVYEKDRSAASKTKSPDGQT
jgi:hypothetical protein